MKTLRKTILLLLLIISFEDLSAQYTQSYLHQQYWNYRQRFRQHFTIIGEDRGEGVPIPKIDVGGTVPAIKLDANNNDLYESADFKGIMDYGGDNTVCLGYYMALLSSEYYLLRDAPEVDWVAVLACQNELYFALNSMERLDKQARQYFRPNLTPDDYTDGFFIRDDPQTSIVNKFLQKEYPRIEWMASITSSGRPIIPSLSDYDTRRFVMPKTEGAVTFNVRNKDETIKSWDAAWYKDEFSNQSPLNEMSQDQLIDILFGMKCIVSFVPSTLLVDPDGANGILPSKNLSEWAKELTDKMMIHLTKVTHNVKTKDPQIFDENKQELCKKMNDKPWINSITGERFISESSCHSWTIPNSLCVHDPCNDYRIDTDDPDNSTLIDRSNYILTNPHTERNKWNNDNGEVYRGGKAFPLGYPLEKLGESITEKDYPGTQVILNGNGIATTLILELFGITSPIKWSLIFLGRPFEPSNPSWWRDFYNFLPNSGPIFNKMTKANSIGLYITLVPASQTWTHSEFMKIVSAINLPEIDLFYSYFNNVKPSVSRQTIENRLLAANCEGITNETDKTVHSPYNVSSIFSKVDKQGAFESGFKDRWYSGLDWMLSYNFYRIADKNFKGLGWTSEYSNDNFTEYTNNVCPCKSSYGFYADRDVPIVSHEHSFSNHILTLPYTPTIDRHKGLGNLNTHDDKSLGYGLEIADFLTTSFAIDANGILKPNGSLITCAGNLFINTGGTLSTSIGTNSNTPKFIKISNGATLEIKSNGTLIIEENSKLYIPKGATLIIHPGAQIILNGPNAVIHINGKMILKPNAEFNPISGTNGYGKVVFENNAGELYVTCEGNNKLIINPGTMGSHLNLEAKGAYGLHTGWQPGLKLFEVKNAKVGIAAGSKITSEAEKTIIDNIHMMGQNWPKNENEYSNGIMAYSTNVEIQNSTFDFLENAIVFSYYPNNPTFKQIVKNNIFTKCKTGVKMNDGTALIENNQFNSNRIGKYGINTVSGGSLSFIKGNTFNVTYSNLQNQWHWSKGSAAVAVNFFNSGGLMLNKNLFHSSTRGLNNKDTRVQLYCNRFHAWNDGENAIYSIQSYGGKLSLKNGYNLFEHYKHYINSNNSKIVLDGGYNLFNLSNQTYPFLMRVVEKEKLELSADYTLSHVNDFSILARNNYWENGYSSITSSNFRPHPANNENMFITWKSSNLDLGYKPFVNSNNNYLGVQNSYCTNNFINPKLDEYYFYSFENSISVPVLLTIPTKPNTIDESDEYGDVLDKMMVEINDDTVDYDKIIKEVIYLNKVNLPDSLSGLAYNTYGLMFDIFNYGRIDTLNTLTWSEYIETYGNLILSNQDTLIQKCENNDSFWSTMRYELYRDKALLLRVLDRRDEAIEILDSLIVNSLIVDINKSHATAWRCIVNQEVMLLDSVISIADIDFELCLPEDTTSFNSSFTHLESDTTIYLCNADSSNGNNLKLHFVTNDTFSSIIYNEFSDTVNADSLNHYNLPLGKYSKIMRDSASQIVYIQFINVYQNTDCYPEVVQPIYEYKDTSFYLCYDGIQNLDSTLYVYQADSSLPYVIINSYYDTLNNPRNHTYHLSFGDYTFSAFDSLNNTYKKTFIKIEFNDTCTFVPEEYEFVIKDTSFVICYNDTMNLNNLTVNYNILDTSLPYTMYDEFLDTFPLSSQHAYDLIVGKYTLTAIDTIYKISYITYINIDGIEEEIIDSTESYYIDCETAYLPYNVSSDSARIYDQWNVLQDSVLFNYYELAGINNEYRVEYKNALTCKIFKTRLDIDDILTAPPSTPNTLLLAKYDRTVDSCAFVKLNNITCNGDSIDFGKTLEIYDENLQYLFTTSVELYGTQTKGFKFCPPYWNTDEEHIANWNALIYKIGVCNYCRIDFKADSFINFPKVLSVQENETKPNITLYPNPSNNEINILILNTNQAKIDIEVFDNMGRLIERKESYLDNNLVKISVQHYSDGVYFIKIPLLNYNGKIMVLK